MTSRPQGASASGSGAASFFNQAGPQKDQWDRKYGPIYRGQALYEKDMATSRALHETMSAITKDNDYIRSTDPDAVKVFKTNLSQLLSSGKTQQLKTVAEATLKQIIERKKNADSQILEVKKQSKLMEDAAYTIWPELRFMVETEITNFIQRYNDAERQSRDHYSSLVEKDATIRALEAELATLKSPSKAAENSAELDNVLQEIKKLRDQRKDTDQAEIENREVRGELLLERTSRKIAEGQLTQREEELRSVRRELDSERQRSVDAERLRTERNEANTSLQTEKKQILDLKAELARKDQTISDKSFDNQKLLTDIQGHVHDKSMKDNHITQLKQDVQKLESAGKEYQKRVDTLIIQIQERGVDINAKAAEVESLQTQLTEKKASVNSLTERISTLNAKIELVQRLANNKEGEIQGLNVTLIENQKALDALRLTYKKASDELNTLHAAQRPVNAADLRVANEPLFTRLDVQRLERERRELKDQNANLVSEKADLAKAKGKIASDLGDANEKLDSANGDILRLNKDLAELKLEHDSNVQEVHQLRLELKTEQGRVASIREQKANLQTASSSEISDLRGQLQKLQSQAESEQRVKESLRQDCERFEREVKRSQQEYDTLSARKTQLSLEATRVRDERNQLQKTLTATEHALDVSKSDVTDLRRRLLMRTTERDGYHSKVVEVIKKSDEMMTAHSETTSHLNEALQTKEKEINKLQSKLQRVGQEKQRLEQELGKANSAAGHYKQLFINEQSGSLSRHQKVQELQSSLATANSELELMQQQQDQLRQKYEASTQKLEAEITTLVNDNQGLERQARRDRKLKNEAQNIADELRLSLAALTSQISTLSRSIDESNWRTSQADSKANDARDARDRAVREAERLAVRYEQEKARADDEHRKAEYFLQEKTNSARNYRQELDQLIQQNRIFYKDLRKEVDDNNRAAMDNLKEWQAEKRKLQQKIDHYEFLGLALVESPRSVQVTDHSRLEPAGPLALKQALSTEINDEFEDLASLTPKKLGERSAQAGAAAHQQDDGDTEMTVDFRDTSMVDMQQGDAGDGSRYSKSPALIEEEVIDAGSERMDLSRASTPDRHDGGVSILGPATQFSLTKRTRSMASRNVEMMQVDTPAEDLIPDDPATGLGELRHSDLMDSIETDDMPVVESKRVSRDLLDIRDGTESSVSREGSIISTSSVGRTRYTEDDVEFLIQGSPAEGPRVTNVHASVVEAVKAQIAKWEKKGRSKAAWASASDTLRCVETRLSKIAANKNISKSSDHRVACDRCIGNLVPCMLVQRGKPPVILPLPKKRRSAGATERDPGYYIVDVG